MTRNVFNKIKNKWMDLVIQTPPPQQFLINTIALQEELSNFSQESSTEFLLPKLNMDLLQNAIIAQAFNFQTFDIDTISIDVISYKKLEGRSLYLMIKRLLQKDFKPFAFLNKREIGYGIEYTLKDNTLRFGGCLTSEIKDQTVIVHIKNHRGRVLREMWITKEDEYLHKEDHVEQTSLAL